VVSERLRFWAAALAAPCLAYGFHVALGGLAASAGFPSWVDYPHPREESFQIGEWWTSATFSGTFSDIGLILGVLTAVLTYFCTRAVYALDIREITGRRPAWLIVGWVLGTLAMGGISVLVSLLYARWSWLEATGSIGAILVFALLLSSVNLFGWAWKRLMRWRGVPG
jgi:hypothetical protein